MPGLDLAEIVELSEEAVALVVELAAATKRTGDGGRKVTRAEALDLARTGAELVSRLLAEIAD